MAFTNEDHLNGHKRKHDIDLHLGIDSSTNAIEGDQTPTPTRFIRNCEEVGLFQDLQNVNPFDETFRKATEFAGLGSIHLPEAASDDSLHTPHIFPHIDQFTCNREFNVASAISDAILKINNKKSKNDFTGPAINVDHSTSDIISISSISTPTTNSNEATIKLKLKEALKNRNKIDEDEIEALNIKQKNVYEQTLNKDTIFTNSVINYRRINKCKDKNKSLKLTRLENKRETNRAAQIRSRERKKHQFRQLANEVLLLRSEIKHISKENQKLKDEVVWLKTMLLYHKDCPVSQDPRVAEEVNSLRKSAEEEKQKELETPRPIKRVVPIHPTPSTFIALAPMTTPLILQVPTQTSSSLLAALTPLLPRPQYIATTISSDLVGSSKALLSNSVTSNNLATEKCKLNKFKSRTNVTKRNK